MIRIGRHLAVRIPREDQNRAGPRLRQDELVVDVVVRDRVLRPTQQRLLAFDPPNRLCIAVRQPGEHRNLRMGHSIGGQELVPGEVVRDPHIRQRR